jgi:putative ABC transport system permease protein
VNNLFVLERIANQNGNDQYWGNTEAPMGPMLKNDFPQVKNMARVKFTGVVFKRGDNVFRESVTFVDDSFYDMLDFPVKWGDKKHFTEKDGIVLTDRLSTKIFGKENPVGKTVNVRFSENGKETMRNFVVKGVFDKQPVESSWYFSALVPHSTALSLGMDKPGDWTQNTNITFVEADNAAALTTVIAHDKKYIDLYNAANPNDKIKGFYFQALNTMSFYSSKVNYCSFNSTSPAGYILLLAIGVALLLLVYFNYMNISMASASGRLKEIGVRKIMGSGRVQIIFQFIAENLILCTIAVIIGLFLAKYIFIPWFSELTTVNLGTTLFTNYRTWVALGTLIIASVLSGSAYPSIYISAFNPVNIIKGKSQMGSSNRFRKVMLGFQFFLTFLAISIAIAFLDETKNAKAKPWGYAPVDNVVVSLDKAASYDAFKDELKGNSIVKSVSGSAQPLGNWTRQLVIKADGKDQTVQSIAATPGFATAIGINIIKGRDLEEQIQTDQTDAVLVNGAFLRQMHWKTGIGKSIEYDHREYKIVGEVNDFHFENFQTPVGPFVLLGCKPADVSYVYVKTSPGLFSNTHKDVEKIWKRVNPNLPFEYYYQDKVFDGYFSSFVQVSKVMSAVSIIMVVISITGIFGLALLILGKKMKEISVRKVLGAGLGNIIFIINKEFLWAIAIALLLGLPISYFVIANLFTVVESESNVSFAPLVLSLVSVIMMTVVSVSWHIYKASTSNPTRYLKEE